MVTASETAAAGDPTETFQSTAAAGSSNQPGGSSVVQEGRDVTSLESVGAGVVSAAETAAVGDPSESFQGTAAAGSSNQLGETPMMPGSDVVFFSEGAASCAKGA